MFQATLWLGQCGVNSYDYRSEDMSLSGGNELGASQPVVVTLTNEPDWRPDSEPGARR